MLGRIATGWSGRQLRLRARTRVGRLLGVLGLLVMLGAATAG
jgi:hypothetical protein